MAHPGPSDQHRAAAPARVRVALLTVSDTRTAATNEGGRLLRQLAEDAGLAVADEALLPDDPAALRVRVVGWARDERADAAVLTGGTGFGPRDKTPDAIGPLYDRRLPGFGELFRWLSFQEIGAAAMLSRAEAGVIGRMAVFLLPGSPAAIELAMRKLIVPELPHLVGQLRAEAPAHRG